MARRGLLTETATAAKEALGVETIDAVADKGYFKTEDIEACEKAGIVPYVPRPQRGPRSRPGCSARTSSNTTRPVTAMSARRASVFIPIHGLFCVT